MSMVKKYKSEVVDIINPIDNIYTISFRCEERKFKYNPGQFLHLAIDEYDGIGQWPDSRCFSIQSSPCDEFIKITFAVKGSFTQQMSHRLKSGRVVWLKLPYGDLFTQVHSKKNTVFIAGGTGITPFLSLFGHESFKEYINPHIYLGFRKQEFNIYDNEMSRLNNSTVIMKLFYEDTNGIIDINQIFDTNGPEVNYFISGPPIMIKNFKQALIKKNTPSANILTDDWE